MASTRLLYWRRGSVISYGRSGSALPRRGPPPLQGRPWNEGGHLPDRRGDPPAHVRPGPAGEPQFRVRGLPDSDARHPLTRPWREGAMVRRPRARSAPRGWSSRQGRSLLIGRPPPKVSEATDLRRPDLADRSATALRDMWRALTIYGESLGSAGLSDALGSPRMQNGPHLNREMGFGYPRNRFRGTEGEPRGNRESLGCAHYAPHEPKIRSEPRNRGKRLGYPRNPHRRADGVPTGYRQEAKGAWMTRLPAGGKAKSNRVACNNMGCAHEAFDFRASAIRNRCGLECMTGRRPCVESSDGHPHPEEDSDIPQLHQAARFS